MEVSGLLRPKRYRLHFIRRRNRMAAPISSWMVCHANWLPPLGFRGIDRVTESAAKKENQEILDLIQKKVKRSQSLSIKVALLDLADEIRKRHIAPTPSTPSQLPLIS